MPELLLEYLPILLFTGIAVVMAVALMLAAYVLAENRPDPEKLSAYECGFPAFDDSRMQFDVRFYLWRSCSSSSISRLPFCSHGRSRLGMSGPMVSGR